MKDTSGRAFVLKPNRSEDSLSKEEQEEYLKKAQDYFENHAPKRVRKPRRSESDDVEDMVAVPTEIPELKVLAQLKKSGEVVLKGTATVSDADEHVETNYYKAMEAAPEHSILGTGFIPLGVKQELPLKAEMDKAFEKVFYATKTNPATNEWTPEESKY